MWLVEVRENTQINHVMKHILRISGGPRNLFVGALCTKSGNTYRLGYGLNRSWSKRDGKLYKTINNDF